MSIFDEADQCRKASDLKAKQKEEQEECRLADQRREQLEINKDMNNVLQQLEFDNLQTTCGSTYSLKHIGNEIRLERIIMSLASHLPILLMRISHSRIARNSPFPSVHFYRFNSYVPRNEYGKEVCGDEIRTMVINHVLQFVAKPAI
jgi:hypothetical protein